MKTQHVAVASDRISDRIICINVNCTVDHKAYWVRSFCSGLECWIQFNTNFGAKGSSAGYSHFVEKVE